MNNHEKRQQDPCLANAHERCERLLPMSEDGMKIVDRDLQNTQHMLEVGQLLRMSKQDVLCSMIIYHKFNLQNDNAELWPPFFVAMASVYIGCKMGSSKSAGHRESLLATERVLLIRQQHGHSSKKAMKMMIPGQSVGLYVGDQRVHFERYTGWKNLLMRLEVEIYHSNSFSLESFCEPLHLIIQWGKELVFEPEIVDRAISILFDVVRTSTIFMTHRSGLSSEEYCIWDEPVSVAAGCLWFAQYMSSDPRDQSDFECPSIHVGGKTRPWYFIVHARPRFMRKTMFLRQEILERMKAIDLRNCDPISNVDVLCWIHQNQMRQIREASAVDRKAARVKEQERVRRRLEREEKSKLKKRQAKIAERQKKARKQQKLDRERQRKMEESREELHRRRRTDSFEKLSEEPKPSRSEGRPQIPMFQRSPGDSSSNGGPSSVDAQAQAEEERQKAQENAMERLASFLQGRSKVRNDGGDHDSSPHRRLDMSRSRSRDKDWMDRSHRERQERARERDRDHSRYQKSRSGGRHDRSRSRSRDRHDRDRYTSKRSDRARNKHRDRH